MKKLLLILGIAFYSTNSFAIVSASLEMVAEVQSSHNDSFEEQYSKYEGKNELQEQTMLDDKNIIFNIVKRQKLIVEATKAQLVGD